MLTTRLPRLQNKNGSTPGGFCGEEYAEWFRLCVLEKIKAFAAQNFQVGANDWYTPEVHALHQQLMLETGWDQDKYGPLFFVARDRDRRHTTSDFDAYRDGDPGVDRCMIPEGEHNWIQFDAVRQMLPSARRVPDCIQSPIEMIVGLVKRDAQDMFGPHDPKEIEDMHRAVWEASQERVQPELCLKCFEKGLRAIRVFKGRIGETVTIEHNKRMVKVHCTQGGWVPRIASG